MTTLLLVQTNGSQAQERHPERAICTVHVLAGDTEHKKVKAFSTYENHTYYFCSKQCKKEFDSDPVAFLPPVLPRPAPDFVVKTFDGEKVSLQDFEEATILLDFWATWCGPCLETMPNLERLHREFADDGFIVLGISLDEGRGRIREITKFIEKVGISYPILVDSEQLAKEMFKIKAIPAMYLIDRQRNIVRQWIGLIDHAEIRMAVVRQIAIGGQ